MKILFKFVDYSNQKQQIMGFFAKIKQMLGIGTVSVKINVPGNVAIESGKIAGSLILTGKSAQQIKSIKVTLDEDYTTGRGDSAKTKTFNLGIWNDNNPFDIAEGEVKNIAFEMPFELQKSSNDKLAEKGGVLGGIGKLANFADNAKSVYKVNAEVDVVGAKLDPTDSCEIKLTK
jgi:hypothetical protein